MADSRSSEPTAPTLTKSALVDRVRDVTGLPRAEAADVVETLLETMKTTLEGGENLKISGFGSFLVRSKSARRGRNPKTAEAITLRRRRVLTFKPSPVLRGVVNGED